MTPMHEFFTKMMNAQQHMMDTLVNNANTFLETMTADESVTKESQSLAKGADAGHRPMAERPGRLSQRCALSKCLEWMMEPVPCGEPALLLSEFCTFGKQSEHT
jgi:hypothetical protein